MQNIKDDDAREESITQSALEDASLHLNEDAPGISGEALERLVYDFRMVMKTLKRLSRLYPQELTEHFIYLPAVSLEQLGDHAAMQDWMAKFEERLRLVEKSGLVYKASLREDRERNVWLPEVELISHGHSTFITFNRDFFGSNDYKTVVTLGDGVKGFTLDREMGSFVLTHEDTTIPASTQEFAINMSNQRHWEAPVQRYVGELLAGEEGPLKKNYNMRWVAAMVADVHRILTRGGLFMYPRDSREPSKPGKLRLMYEANPMSFLVEQAGGASTDGHQRILDIQPEGLHQRVAVFLGSKEEVARATAYHKE